LARASSSKVPNMHSSIEKTFSGSTDELHDVNDTMSENSTVASG